jgi:glycerol-3-phosphate dehydrogenase
VNRESAIQAISDRSTKWDCLIIGGGATGLGAALEAVSRGYRTVLLEKFDFAKGTSSRSTKLVHGGVRYLEQGNLHLVREALRERGLLLRNASHLAHPMRFVIPAYRYWQLPFYGVGLKIYDALAGKLSLGKSKVFGRSRTVDLLPNVEPEQLKGGIQYFDGQFDDARLAICLLRTFQDLGGVATNYAEVCRLLKADGKLSGAVVRDRETGQEYEVQAKCVINATGVFADTIRELDDPKETKIIAVAQGSHLVLPFDFLQSDSALMVPKTSDGRVLFAIPWHDRLVVGTTDFSVPQPEEEPRIQRHEVDFMLSEAGKYLAKDPTAGDVLACYSGLRPLVKPGGGKNTAAISRDHTVLVSPYGLITITGGKWTTYRRMGQDGIDRAAEVAGLEPKPSRTESLSLHGNPDPKEAGASADHLSGYGADRAEVEKLAREENGPSKIHPRLPYLMAEISYAVVFEMARTVEDVLSRRTRARLLAAQAARDSAPKVARVLSEKLGRDEAWIDDQVRSFSRLSENYLLPNLSH